MPFAKKFMVALLFGLTGVGCQSIRKSLPRDPANDSNPRLGIRDTDNLRVRINQLQTLKIPDRGILFVSARLLVCVVAADTSEICNDLGSTGGLEIAANQTKDFRGETASSMPALYSKSYSGKDFNGLLRKLPANLASATPYFKVELRKSLASNPGATTIGFQKFNLPPLGANPTDVNKILQKQISMKAVPEKVGFEFGAEMTFLIHRPN